MATEAVFPSPPIEMCKPIILDSECSATDNNSSCHTMATQQHCSQLNEMAKNLVHESSAALDSCSQRINETDLARLKSTLLEDACHFLFKALNSVEGISHLLQVHSPNGRHGQEREWKYATNSQQFPSRTEESVCRCTIEMGDSDYSDIKVSSPQHPEYDEGMKYFQSLISVNPTSNCFYVAATLLYNLGQVRILQNRYDEAISCFVDSSMIVQQVSEISHALTFQCLHNIAFSQYRCGRMQKSYDTLSEALKLCSQQVDRKENLAATLNSLGVLNFHLRKSGTEKAMDCFTRSLSLLYSVFGTEHTMIATVLNNIGRIYYTNGDFQHALAVYKEALRLRIKLLGDNHLDVAATMFNTGQTLHHQGELDAALEQYNGFIQIALAQLGPSHRDVAFMLKCIGQVYYQKGENDFALQVYKQALDSSRAALGVHAEVASILNKLGNILYDMEKYNVSLEMYQQGLEVERAVFPPFHPNITVTLSNIGQIHKQRGDLLTAFKVYEEVYAIQLASVGSRDPTVAVTLSNMALMHYQTRNYGAALELYQQTLAIRKESLGEKNLVVASTLNSIGLVLFKLGILGPALKSFVKSYMIRRELLGDSHRDVAVNLYNIATIELELGDEEKAMHYYRETLRVEQKSLGRFHIDCVQTLNYLAQLHQQRGDAHHAMLFYNEVLLVQQQNLDVDPEIWKTLKNIGLLCLQDGNTAAFLDHMANAARLSPKFQDQHDWASEIFQLHDYSRVHPEAAAAA